MWGDNTSDLQQMLGFDMARPYYVGLVSKKHLISRYVLDILLYSVG